MNLKLLRDKLTARLLEGLVFGLGLILIAGIAYAFTTWDAGQPPLTGPADGNVKVKCDPLLAGGDSTYTEGECKAAGGTVITADSVNLCSFKPGVGGHTCTDLNCNTTFSPPSTIKDSRFAAHPRYWSCPAGWSRYKNWGQYSTNGCWVTQDGWYNYDPNADTCYHGGGFSGVCTMWPSSCAAGQFMGLRISGGVRFPWAENNNKDGYYLDSGRYGGAACPSGTNQHFAFAIMEDIGCY